MNTSRPTAPKFLNGTMIGCVPPFVRCRYHRPGPENLLMGRSYPIARARNAGGNERK